MAEPAQLHNAYVIGELIQLTVQSRAEIVAYSHWTDDLRQEFSIECLIEITSHHHKKARGGC